MTAMSALTIAPQPLPLVADAEGVVRVAGTRVTLDTIVGAFRHGASAEEIASRYPTVPLVDVYSTVAFYLSNGQAVDAYLVERQGSAAVLREKERSLCDQSGLRERLLSRRQR